MKLQFISSSKAKQIQRSFQSFRLTLLCGVLTLLVLRGTLGAGKFGTPAQDFEEIKSRFKRAPLHRKQFKFASRVLNEVGMKSKPAMDLVENGAEVARNDAITGRNDGIQLRNYAAETLEKLIESARKGVESAQGDDESAAKDAKPVPNDAGFAGRMAEGRPIVQEISGHGRSEKLRATMKQGRPRMMLIVTSSSRPSSGDSPSNDLTLKSVENKLHYCRIHGIEISYKAEASPELLRKMMLAEPGVEWIWWMDGDAFITDMGFEIPVEGYDGHNLVLLSEEEEEAADMGIQKLDMVGSSFLIRNCRWSLDLLGQAHAAPPSPSPSSASSSALLHDLLALLPPKEREKVLVESSCHHHQQQHHHHRHEQHLQSRDRNQDMEMEGSDADADDADRWPFIIRLVGCKPCDQKQKDAGDAATARCPQLMERALDFAHNQTIPF